MQFISVRSPLISLIVRLWGHFSYQRKRQVFFVMGLILISTFAEVLSLGAVLPFIGVLIAPEKILNSPFFFNLARDFGINSAEQLILSTYCFWGYSGRESIAGGFRWHTRCTA